MNYFLNKNTVIMNPLRILFLCGSKFKSTDTKVTVNGSLLTIRDKRLLLKEWIENTSTIKSKTIKPIILEENFMFNEDKYKLNYKDINLYNLKTIEILTSLLSDNVIILHESFSTAAEIGMLSTSTYINKKLLIFTPYDYSMDESYIAGFMNHAYKINPVKGQAIEIVNYYPGVYKYSISNRQYKYHSFFVNNTIPETIEKKMNLVINSYGEEKMNFNSSNYEINTEENKVKVFLKPRTIFYLIIALFSIEEVKEEFRNSIDLNSLIYKNKFRNRLFSEKTNYLMEVIKKILINTLKIEAPSIKYETDIEIFISGKKKQYKDLEFINIVSYSLYLLYAAGYIHFKDKEHRFVITTEFSEVCEEYASMFTESNSSSLFGGEIQ